MSVELEQDLQKIARQETALVFEHFDENVAAEVGNAIVAAGRSAGYAIIVEICKGDALQFFAALPGTTAANQDWARRKRGVFRLTQESTYAASLKRKAGMDIVEAMALDPRDYTAHGGCFPITVKGAGVIGSVTVSGIPSDRLDHNLVVDVLANYLGIELGTDSF